MTDGILLGCTSGNGTVVDDQHYTEQVVQNHYHDSKAVEVSYDQTRYLWSAYPKDKFYVPKATEPQVEYRMYNDVTWTLLEQDPAVSNPGYGKPEDPREESSVSATAQVSYSPIGWSAPGAVGTSSVRKWTQRRYLKDYNYGYGLNLLRQGKEADMRFVVLTVCDGYAYTKDTSGAYEGEDAYGRVGWRQVTEDYDTFFNYSETPLTSRDFTFTAIDIATPIKYRYGKNESGKWGNVRDNSLPTPDLLIEYQLNGDGKWHKAATAIWGKDGRGALSFDVDENAQGVGVRDSSTLTFPDTTTDVRYSYVSNVFNRTRVEKSELAGIEWFTYPYIQLKPSKEMKAQVENLFADLGAPTTKVKNDVRTKIYTGCTDAQPDGMPLSDGYNGYDYSRATISGAVYGVYLTKTGEYDPRSVENGGDNDAGNQRITIHYSAAVREQSNLTKLEEYQEAVASHAIAPETSCIWYDLLPEGVMPDLKSIRLRKGDTLRGTTVLPNFRGSGRTLLIVEADLTPVPEYSSIGYFDSPQLTFDGLYTWDSLSDLGTKLVNYIAFESTSDLLDGTLGTQQGQQGEPDTPGGNPDDGAYMNNHTKGVVPDALVPVLSGLDPSRSGSRFVYDSADVNLIVDTKAESGIKKRVRSDIAGVWSQGLTGQEQVTVYEGQRYSYDIRVASSASSTTTDIVIYDTIENYDIPDPASDTQDDGTKAGDFNDREEKSTWKGDWQGKGQWRGTLLAVELMQFLEAGVQPVLYYSTTPNLQFEDTDRNEDLTHEEKLQIINSGSYVLPGDGVNEAQWQAAALDANGIWTVPDGVNVTAIAIDARRDVNGDPFVLPEDEAMTAYLRMVAPNDHHDEDVWNAKGAYAHVPNPDYDGSAGSPKYLDEVYWEKALEGPENNMYAFNNCRLKCVLHGTGGIGSSSWMMIRNDYTRVGILPSVVEVTKEWADQDNHDGMRPQSVLVTLLRRVMLSDKDFEPVKDDKDRIIQVTLDETNDWKHTFLQMDVENEVGDRYQYAFLETNVDGSPIKGYTSSTIKVDDNTYKLINTHPNQQVQLAGVKRWDDNTDAEGARPDFITVRLYCDGEFVKSLKVTPDANGDWKYDFGSMDALQPGGQPHVYTVEEDYVPKYSASYTGYADVLNTYYPYGNLEVIKHLTGATPAAEQIAFSFTLTMISGDTDLPLANAYTAVRSTLQKDGTWREDETFQIHSGEKFTLKGDQKLLVKNIPSEATYSITEDPMPGFTLTDRVNDTGVIRAAQTSTAELTNAYAAQGSLQLYARKDLSGHAIFRNQFHFELVDLTVGSPTENQVISTGLNTLSTTVQAGGPSNPILSSAAAAFGQLYYTTADAGKQMHYLVREVDEGKAGYTYDKTTYEIWVLVEDKDGNGTLTTTISMDEDMKMPPPVDPTVRPQADPRAPGDALFVFANQYKAQGSVALEAWKTLEGRALTDGEFTFDLCRLGPDEDFETMDPAKADVIQTKTCGADGKVTFDALVFDQNHVDYREDKNAQYRYGIREKHGSDSTVHYTNTRYVVTLTLYDNNDGTLTILQDNQQAVRKYNPCKRCEGTGKSLINYAMGLDHKPLDNVSITEKKIHVDADGHYYLSGGIQVQEYKWYWNNYGESATVTSETTEFHETPYTLDRLDLCDTCRGMLTVNGAMCPVCKGTGYRIGGVYKFANNKDELTYEFVGLLQPAKLKQTGEFVYTMKMKRINPDNEDHYKYYGTRLLPIYEECPDCGGTGRGNPAGMDVSGDAPHRVFTNTVKDGSILVSKVINGNPPASHANDVFTFKMLLTGDADRVPASLTGTRTSSGVSTDVTVPSNAGTFTFQLRGGEQMLFSAVPAGLAYDIWEETPNGWVLLQQEHDTGVVQPLKTSTPTFTNEYLPKQEYVYLRATKMLDDSAVPDGMEFQFALDKVDENGVVLQNVATISSRLGGAIIFEPIVFDDKILGADNTKTLYYTLTEVLPADPDTEDIVYDNTVHHITVTLSLDGDGNLVSDVKYDNQAEAPVFNNKTKPGSLTVTKTVPVDTSPEAIAHPDSRFPFKAVFMKNGKPWDGVSAFRSDITEVDANAGSVIFYLRPNQSFTFNPVPAGVTYTVNEMIQTVSPDDPTVTIGPDNPFGWTMDTRTGTGTIVTAPDNPDDFQTEEFHNTYAPTGFVILKAYKELTGRTVQEDEFSFSLYEVDSATAIPPAAAIPLQSVENDAIDTNDHDNPDYGRSTVTFQAIHYTEPGTHYYVIRENEGYDDTIEYDLTPRHVTVTVTDMGNGRLNAECDYDGNGSALPTFVNRVEVGTLALSKTVVGKTPCADEFHFIITLMDAHGEAQAMDFEAVLQSVDANTGSVTESKQQLSFGWDDKLQMDGVARVALHDGERLQINGIPDQTTYTVTEVDIPKGYQPTADSITDTVLMDQTSHAAFVNTYSAKGEYTFSAFKTMEGMELEDGHFRFALLNPKTGQIVYAFNDADGHVVFPALSFTEQDVGQHPYTLYEVGGVEEGYVYDDTEYALTLDISDKGDGKLDIRASGIPGEGITFTNQFTISGAVHVEASKWVNAHVPGAKHLYSFTLTRVNEDGTAYRPETPGTATSWTVQNDADGHIVFEDIPIVTLADVQQSLYFLLKESSPSGDGVTADASEYVLEVTTSNDGNDGMQLTSKWYLRAQGATDWKGVEIITPNYAPVFNNHYAAAGRAELTAAKQVNGGLPGANGPFSFELLDEQGAVLQTATNTPDGMIRFNLGAFDENDIGAVMNYSIREATTVKPGYTRDDRVYDVTVELQDSGKGQVVPAITVSLGGQQLGGMEDIVFDNQYRAEGQWTPTASKLLDGAEPADDQIFSFHLAGDNTAPDGQPVITDLTADNQKGSILFSPISYVSTVPGSTQTYVYRMSETTTPTENLRVDGRVFVATVSVKDQADGTLSITTDWTVEVVTDAMDETDSYLFGDPNAVGDEPVFENSLVSTLTITKLVTGAATDAAFNFQIDLTDAAQQPLTGAYPVQISAMDAAEGADVRTTTVRSGGSIQLAHGEKAVVTGIPQGAVYTVTEAPNKRFTTAVNGETRSQCTGTLTAVGAHADFVNAALKTSFSVSKEWIGGYGGSIELVLYADGKQMQPQPHWSRVDDVYTASDLPLYDDDGHIILYSAREEYVDGYMTIYSNVGAYRDKTNYVYNGGTIVNRPVTSMSFHKAWNCPEAYIPKTFTVTVYRNGKEYRTKKFNVNKSGVYVIGNLPAGSDEVYSVVEESMENFEASYANVGAWADVTDRVYQDGVITNTATKLTVPKTGDDTPVGLACAALLTSCCALFFLRRKRRQH